MTDIAKAQHTLARIQAKLAAAIAAGRMRVCYNDWNGQLFYEPIYPADFSEPFQSRLHERHLADAYVHYYGILWMAGAIEWRGRRYI